MARRLMGREGVELDRQPAELLQGHRWHPQPPLGAILVSIGVLTDAQLNLALAKQRRLSVRRPIGELLLEMGVLQRKSLDHALKIQESTISHRRAVSPQR